MAVALSCCCKHTALICHATPVSIARRFSQVTADTAADVNASFRVRSSLRVSRTIDVGFLGIQRLAFPEPGIQERCGWIPPIEPLNAGKGHSVLKSASTAKEIDTSSVSFYPHIRGLCHKQPFGIPGCQDSRLQGVNDGQGPAHIARSGRCSTTLLYGACPIHERELAPRCPNVYAVPVGCEAAVEVPRSEATH